MNKLIIGLLIVAAGAGAYFLLNKKKEKPTSQAINKEWIIGKWKTNDTPGIDSNFNKFQYDFQQEGRIVQSLNDSTKSDTTHYEWNKKSELVWKTNATDSVGKTFQVTKLTIDSLLVKATDSSFILFTRAK